MASNRFNDSCIFPFHRFYLSLNKLFEKIWALLWSLNVMPSLSHPGHKYNSQIQQIQQISHLHNKQLWSTAPCHPLQCEAQGCALGQAFSTTTCITEIIQKEMAWLGTLLPMKISFLSPAGCASHLQDWPWKKNAWEALKTIVMHIYPQWCLGSHMLETCSQDFPTCFQNSSSVFLIMTLP